MRNRFYSDNKSDNCIFIDDIVYYNKFVEKAFKIGIEMREGKETKRNSFDDVYGAKQYGRTRK